jgi:F420H(2)-dependent quinone reductase
MSGRAAGHAAGGAARTFGMEPQPSTLWRRTFRVAYAFLGAIDPLLRWTWFSVGLGITSRLTVRGRRTGRQRTVLVGLLRVDGRWYVGHPNGEAAWTANLRDATSVTVALRPEAPMRFAAVLLEDGAERTAVIRATAEQQPFPGNLLYRAARRHILSVGRYFRLEPM